MFERENVSVKDKRKNISNPLAIFPSAKLVNKISPTEKINTNTSCKNARVLTLRAKVDKIVNRSRKKMNGRNNALISKHTQNISNGKGSLKYSPMQIIIHCMQRHESAVIALLISREKTNISLT